MMMMKEDNNITLLDSYSYILFEEIAVFIDNFSLAQASSIERIYTETRSRMTAYRL